MTSPALLYLLRRRGANRIRTFVRGLARPKNAFTLLVGLAVVGLLAADVSPADDMAPQMRHALISSLFGFLLILTSVSSLGQEGMTFSAADLDLLFPGPFRRRQLLLYWFVPQYILSLAMTLFWMLMLGGRRLPHPAWFFCGCFFFQALTVHASVLSAQVGILIAERFFSRARPFLRFLTTALLLGLLLGMMLTFVGSGSISKQLAPIAESRAVRVIFFPAVAAADLGIVDGTERIYALLKLLGACAASFALVMLADIGFIEASFNASRRVHARVASVRRGVWTSKRRLRGGSAHAPRRWRGAWAIFWRDILTLRRQLRTLVGGVLMITILIGIAAARSESGSIAQMILIYLAMLPLWLSPPIGFRVAPPALAAYRMLPLAPSERALGMSALSVLVPWLFQLVVVIGLVLIGLLRPAPAVALLFVYAAVCATLVLVEGLFHVRGGSGRRTDFATNFFRMMLQILALMPAGAIGAVALVFTHSTAWSLVLAFVTQSILAFGLLHWAGARLDRYDLRIESE